MATALRVFRLNQSDSSSSDDYSSGVVVGPRQQPRRSGSLSSSLTLSEADNAADGTKPMRQHKPDSEFEAPTASSSACASLRGLHQSLPSSTRASRQSSTHYPTEAVPLATPHGLVHHSAGDRTPLTLSLETSFTTLSRSPSRTSAAAPARTGSGAAVTATKPMKAAVAGEQQGLTPQPLSASIGYYNGQLVQSSAALLPTPTTVIVRLDADIDSNSSSMSSRCGTTLPQADTGRSAPLSAALAQHLNVATPSPPSPVPSVAAGPVAPSLVESTADVIACNYQQQQPSTPPQPAVRPAKLGGNRTLASRSSSNSHRMHRTTAHRTDPSSLVATPDRVHSSTSAEVSSTVEAPSTTNGSVRIANAASAKDDSQAGSTLTQPRVVGDSPRGMSNMCPAGDPNPPLRARGGQLFNRVGDTGVIWSTTTRIAITPPPITASQPTWGGVSTGATLLEEQLATPTAAGTSETKAADADTAADVPMWSPSGVGRLSLDTTHLVAIPQRVGPAALCEALDTLQHSLYLSAPPRPSTDTTRPSPEEQGALITRQVQSLLQHFVTVAENSRGPPPCSRAAPPRGPADGGGCGAHGATFALHSWLLRWPPSQGRRKDSSSDMASLAAITATGRGRVCRLESSAISPPQPVVRLPSRSGVPKRRALPTTPDATIRRSTQGGGLPPAGATPSSTVASSPSATAKPSPRSPPRRSPAQEESSYQPSMTRPRRAAPTYGEDEWTGSVFVAHRRRVEGSPPHGPQLPRWADADRKVANNETVGLRMPSGGSAWDRMRGARPAAPLVRNHNRVRLW